MTRTSPAATAIASLVSERDWQRQVTDAAELFGWSWAHFRPARRANGGWYTAVSGPLGAGFTDLVLAKPGRLLFVECKRQDGQTTPGQAAVHEQLRAAGAEVHVWRPSDLPQALEILR